MTRHEAQALVIAAIGHEPAVRRIDYEVNTTGEGVIVTVMASDGERHLATRLDRLAAMTVDEFRAYFRYAQRRTEWWLARQAEEKAQLG